MDAEDVLGCSKNCTLEEFRTAYLRLSKQLHPDKNQGKVDERLVQVQKAWETIKTRFDAQAKQSPPQEVDIADLEFIEDEQTFRYRCRCGYDILVPAEQLQQGRDVVTCSSCSLRIKLLYDLEEE